MPATKTPKQTKRKRNQPAERNRAYTPRVSEPKRITKKPRAAAADRPEDKGDTTPRRK